METPLFSALVALSERNTGRMHMPGHKGISPPGFIGGEIFPLDFTEITGTGNLYEGIPPISTAEKLLADAVGAADAFFLTGGSTQGIMAAMAAACKLQSTVVIDRGCHRAVWNSMVHLDLTPAYIYPGRIEPWDISSPITPMQVEHALKKNPGASAVVITSPTYYGVIADIEGISQVSKRYGAALIVDEAHGAHLPFMDGFRSSITCGASLAVVSAHKTLPALTPGAYILSDGSFPAREIRQRSSMFGTSSPSYPVMASMDYARAYMQEEGGAELHRVANSVRLLRDRINSSTVFRALTAEDIPILDPTRLTVNSSTGGISGFDAAAILEKDYDIFCEMADYRNIVMIFTGSDTEQSIEHVAKAFNEMSYSKEKIHRVFKSYDFPRSNRALSPRDAGYAEKHEIKLAGAEGWVSGEHVSPYPPGIPVVAAGEIITADHLAYLKHIEYDIEQTIFVCYT